MRSLQTFDDLTSGCISELLDCEERITSAISYQANMRPSLRVYATSRVHDPASHDPASHDPASQVEDQLLGLQIHKCAILQMAMNSRAILDEFAHDS